VHIYWSYNTYTVVKIIDTAPQCYLLNTQIIYG